MAIEKQESAWLKQEQLKNPVQQTVILKGFGLGCNKFIKMF